MAKDQVRKRNGNGAAKRNGASSQRSNSRKRAPRSLAPRSLAPVGAAPLAQTKNGSGFSVTHLRFQFASLLRLSDNLVTKAVDVYDRLFALDQRDEAEIHLQMGRELAHEDKFDEALAALRKVLASRPEHAEALYEVGMIQLKRGAPRAAAESLKKAKAAGRRDCQLHLCLADALDREERLEEALAEIEAAIALKPKLADSHYRRAVTLDRLGRYEGAIEAFQLAIELAPAQIRYHQSLGFTLEALGRRSDAIKCFKRALELERSAERSNGYPEP